MNNNTYGIDCCITKHFRVLPSVRHEKCTISTPREKPDVYMIANILDGGFWQCGRINFEERGAVTGFRAWIKATGDVAWIDIRIDHPDGPQIGVCQVAVRDMGSEWTLAKAGIYAPNGERDIYLCFRSQICDPFVIAWCEFTSDLVPKHNILGDTVISERVPYLGPLEKNFIGSGKAGGGGDPNNIWDYLIGPYYSNDSFINREELSISLNGVDFPLVMETRRHRGTGIFSGIVNLGQLTVSVFDYAPMEEAKMVRLVFVDNNSDTDSCAVKVRAAVIPAQKCAVNFKKLSQISDNGCDALCLSLNNGTNAQIYWDSAFHIYKDDNGFLLESEFIHIPKGSSHKIALFHGMYETTTDNNLQACLAQRQDASQSLEHTFRQWKEWLLKGKRLDGIPDLRARDIVESSIIFIKMQQGADGGIMATPRTYNLSYIRDNCSSLRGLMASGHYEEARRFLLRTEEGFQLLKKQGIYPFPSAIGIGNDTFFPGFGSGESWCAETPALYILIAKMYHEKTGDVQTLLTIDASLNYAMETQLQYAEKYSWKLPFNGDETDSGGSGIHLADRREKWSMPSMGLFASSLEFIIIYTEQIKHCPVRHKLRECLSFVIDTIDTDFWREDLGIYDWYRGEDGEWPTHRLTSYHMFPLYWHIPLNKPARAAKSALAMKAHFSSDNSLPIQPGGANEDYCGHTLGYLLYSLSELNDPMKNDVYSALLERGTVGCWGTWCEAYHATGLSYGPGDTWNNMMHNLRPFESGTNVDAILRYWNVNCWF